MKKNILSNVVRTLLVGAAVYTLADMYFQSKNERNFKQNSPNIYRMREQHALETARDTFYVKDGTRCWDIDIDGDGQRDLWIRAENYDTVPHGLIFLRGSMSKNIYQDTLNSVTCAAFNEY